MSLGGRTTISSAPGAPPLPAGGGRVEIEDVSLHYEGAEDALSGIDLDVVPGQAHPAHKPRLLTGGFDLLPQRGAASRP